MANEQEYRIPICIYAMRTVRAESFQRAYELAESDELDNCEIVEVECDSDSPAFGFVDYVAKWIEADILARFPDGEFTVRIDSHDSLEETRLDVFYGNIVPALSLNPEELDCEDGGADSVIELSASVIKQLEEIKDGRAGVQDTVSDREIRDGHGESV